MENASSAELNVREGGISAVSVKLRGLPFKALEQDISDFFEGYNVQRALLKRYPDGRPNGEAFVVFGGAEEAQKACLKDREIFCEGDKFGDRYVRVYPTVESDLPDIQECLAAASSHGPEGSLLQPIASQGDSVIKVKSLPYDACQLDVLMFFDGFKMRPNGVQLVIQGNNKPSGEAFVDFDSGAEAERAITTKDRQVFAQKFGDRYVPRSEMQAALALRFGGDGIVKMKGLPFKATADDVIKFFAGYRVRPDGIHFVMHADGRPSGMAFVEFDCPQEAMRALSKDREQFGVAYGERFCLLQLVGRAELAKASTRRATPLNASNGYHMQGNMAAAAAALANSLGAASCGMGSPGVSQSNPLLGQYAALLGLARSPSEGPGIESGAMAQLQALHTLQGMGGIQGMGPPSMLPPHHGGPLVHPQDWMAQPHMNGQMNGLMPSPQSGPPHPNMQDSRLPYNNMANSMAPGMPPPGNMGPMSDPTQHPYNPHAPPPGLQSYGIASEMGLGGSFPPNGSPMSNGVMRLQPTGTADDLSQQNFAGNVRPHDTTLPEELPRKRNRQ
ncbi:MAG: RNA binding [Trebouxia sp. A1-2]|nr:MAG: RNA binding [Trebouxia sp. A1-2]